MKCQWCNTTSQEKQIRFIILPLYQTKIAFCKACFNQCRSVPDVIITDLNKYIEGQNYMPGSFTDYIKKKEWKDCEKVI